MIPGIDLKVARISAGLSQRQIAQALGVSVAYVSAVELGRRRTSTLFAERYLGFVGEYRRRVSGIGVLPNEAPPLPVEGSSARYREAVRQIADSPRGHARER
jgi:transcriptional regulator with XRE-family HTH domain